MKHLKRLNKFWGKKKYHIDEVQDEPIEEGKLEELIKEFDKERGLGNRYSSAFFANRYNIEREQYYFIKCIEQVHKMATILYKIVRIKKDVDIDGWILKDKFDYLVDLYSGVKIGSIHTPKGRYSLKLMNDVTYFLNRIYFITDDKYDIFYPEEIDNNIHFRSSEREEELRKKNKNLDPFGEEDWNEKD